MLEALTLRALEPRGKTQRHEVQKAIDSFTANAGRMDDPTYATHHWPIGSGIIESTYRRESSLRTKERGMRWSEGGVQGILSLRLTPVPRRVVGRLLPSTTATAPTARPLPGPIHSPRHHRHSPCVRCINPAKVWCARCLLSSVLPSPLPGPGGTYV